MSSTVPRGVPELPDALHPIPIGNIVAVLAFRGSGQPYFEGRAVIQRPAPGTHRYLVRFAGDPAGVVHERFVHPEYQQDPEGYLAWMIEFWLACAPPAIADFFPDEIPT
ncbi:MAG: hypothetical protein P4M09_06010 [Devosia sp.]|nr:hypothetical protein [Devosia sp.]